MSFIPKEPQPPTSRKGQIVEAIILITTLVITLIVGVLVVTQMNDVCAERLADGKGCDTINAGGAYNLTPIITNPIFIVSTISITVVTIMPVIFPSLKKKLPL